MQTLRLFSDVVRCHSFSEAAARHGITQSAASQRVGALERRLGVKLLDRSVRPLALTEAGQQFFDGCEELLRQYEMLERRVARMQGQSEGTVRVAAIYSAGIELLNRLREAFEAEHPRIAIELRYDQPEGVYTAVREFDCDLGIISYPERWPQVGTINLRDEAMAVVCRPDHPLAHRQRLHASELSDFEMVTFDMDLPVARHIRRYLREQGASPRVTDSFDNIDTIKSAVAVTDRFAILPQRTVGREAEAGTLAVVALEPRLVRPMGILYRRRHRQTAPFAPASQRFVDYLLQHAGPRSNDDSDEATAAASDEQVTPGAPANPDRPGTDSPVRARTHAPSNHVAGASATHKKEKTTKTTH